MHRTYDAETRPGKKRLETRGRLSRHRSPAIAWRGDSLRLSPETLGGGDLLRHPAQCEKERLDEHRPEHDVPHGGLSRVGRHPGDFRAGDPLHGVEVDRHEVLRHLEAGALQALQRPGDPAERVGVARSGLPSEGGDESLRVGDVDLVLPRRSHRGMRRAEQVVRVLGRMVEGVEHPAGLRDAHPCLDESADDAQALEVPVLIGRLRRGTAHPFGEQTLAKVVLDGGHGHAAARGQFRNSHGHPLDTDSTAIQYG